MKHELTKSKVEPFIRERVERVGHSTGAYELIGKNKRVIYVGHTRNLSRRLQEHRQRGDVPATYFRVFKTQDASAARKLERDLIEKNEPRYNIRGL